MSNPSDQSSSTSYVAEDNSLVLNDSRKGRKVLSTLKILLSQCKSFRFFVAFVNREGVISIAENLRRLEKLGVKGEVLVSQYLNFTEPLALRSLIAFKNLDVRINTDDSMHGKGYFFFGEGRDINIKVLWFRRNAVNWASNTFIITNNDFYF